MNVIIGRTKTFNYYNLLMIEKVWCRNKKAAKSNIYLSKCAAFKIILTRLNQRFNKKNYLYGFSCNNVQLYLMFFTGLSQQLDQPGVKKIRNILELSRSSYVVPFLKLSRLIQVLENIYLAISVHYCLVNVYWLYFTNSG